MADIEIGSADWWLARLIQKLSDRQERYEELLNWAIGKHPLPNGDQRYVKALKELQKKAKTNYISLVLKAVTQRMRVKEFKFAGEVDEEAGHFWKSNNMEFQATIAINDGAKFGDMFALVSPPDEDGQDPIITIEDPRWCAVERDPIRPFKSLAGLKIYEDFLEEAIVAVLYLPEGHFVYHGPKPNDRMDFDQIARRMMDFGAPAAGFELVETHENPLGEVPLVYSQWQPATGLAECEDGAFAIQDRINHTILDRLIISKNQAYRQRMITGATLQKKKDGNAKPPFDPGSDMVWVSEDKDAKVWDLEQADIKQLLEAIRDDIGDLAALTQTPVTYLTNRMVNVSGDALTAAHTSHSAKVRERMHAVGWFFETVIRLCFRYQGSAKADEVDAEVQWADPEVRTLQEMAELVAKFAAAGVPMDLVLERAGFSADEIERAMAEIERIRKEEQQAAVELAKTAPPQQMNSTPGGSK